jgi:hypothetical protein
MRDNDKHEQKSEDDIARERLEAAYVPRIFWSMSVPTVFKEHAADVRAFITDPAQWAEGGGLLIHGLPKKTLYGIGTIAKELALLGHRVWYAHFHHFLDLVTADTPEWVEHFSGVLCLDHINEGRDRPCPYTAEKMRACQGYIKSHLMTGGALFASAMLPILQCHWWGDVCRALLADRLNEMAV